MSDEPPARRRWLLGGVAGAVAVLAVVAVVLAAGGSGGARSRTPLAGFAELGFRVELDGRTLDQVCALLADTEPQRERGLMGVRDLKGYAGMLFRFDADTDDRFYMKDTPMPLSIAWFDSHGLFVSSTDMDPCVGQGTCPTYAAARPYRTALEVPKGSLAALGIGPGSSIVLTGACPLPR